MNYSNWHVGHSHTIVLSDEDSYLSPRDPDFYGRADSDVEVILASFSEGLTLGTSENRSRLGEVSGGPTTVRLRHQQLSLF